jgi:tetratricopeptide (TPR) repeat protein
MIFFRAYAPRIPEAHQKLQAFVSPVTLCALLLACFYVAQGQSGNKAAAVEAHLQQGQEALRNRNPDAAGEEFEAALALDPRNAEAHDGLGILAFNRGDCTAAEKEFRSALAVNTALVSAQGLLGICEKRAGETSAKTSLQDAFTRLKDPKLRIEVGVELAGLYYHPPQPPCL